MTKRFRGVLIAFEGIDGAGKRTQTDLLARRLRRLGRRVVIFDFPQYGRPSAYFVEQYLQGKYGSSRSVSPYQASLFYALDRFSVATAIRKALSRGAVVISNRYVGSNMAHQGAGIRSAAERKKFFVWVRQLEFDIIGLPKPTSNLVLALPAQRGQQRTQKKQELLAADLGHLQRAAAVYATLPHLYPREFALIQCGRGAQLLTIAQVHEKIWQQVCELVG